MVATRYVAGAEPPPPAGDVMVLRLAAIAAGGRQQSFTGCKKESRRVVLWCAPILERRDYYRVPSKGVSW
jgi:hypothetical protein